MEPRISSLTLGVADLQRSVHFYRPSLIFSSQHKAGGGALAQGAVLPPQGSPFERVCLAQDVPGRLEADRVLAEALHAGGSLLKPAMERVLDDKFGVF